MAKRKRAATKPGASHPYAGDDTAKAINDFFKELEKRSNVVFLTKEESELLHNNNEFDGCIARPKTHDA